MLKKLLLISAILFVSASLAQAQGGPVLSSGIVVLGSTGRPVSGATVTFCTSGATGIPCSPTVTVYSDVALTMPTGNPQFTDGNGNVSVYAPAGNYKYTVTGQGVSLVGQPFTAVVASSSGTITGTILINQVAFGIGGSSLGGSLNFLYQPSIGGLFLMSSNAGPTNVTGSSLALQNSLGGTITYFVKDSLGNLFIRNGNDLVAVNGVIELDNSGQITLNGGGNAPKFTMYASASVSPFGVGSAVMGFNNTGVGPHVFAVGTTSLSFPGYISLDPFLAAITLGGSIDGVATWGVAPHAGIPNPVQVPTVTGNANYCFQTDGANPQQTRWGQCVLVASLVTTAATTDNVTVTGMTSSGHCSLTPTNTAASGLAAIPYVSAKTTNQITVTHSATANANFDVLCTPY